MGDKRSQVVYDLRDPATSTETIDELIASGEYLVFAPDSLAEARNRGYHPRRH